MNYLYPNSDVFIDAFSRQYIETKPIGINIIDDGIIVPFDYDDAEVCDESNRVLFDEIVDYIDDEVVYIGAFTNGHFGNFLIDNLRWVL